jgi:hypothetical protein
MYFKKFPLDLYSLDDTKSIQLVTDILRRITLNEEIKNNNSIFDEYDIKEGETPERLADKIYGDTNYHWVILHVNNIIDPRFDWPLTNYQLEQMVKSKYGSNNIQAIHHYENVDGNWVNSNFPSATVISNFVYEEKLNEEKRRIKILKPKFLVAIETEFDNKIRI